MNEENSKNNRSSEKINYTISTFWYTIFGDILVFDSKNACSILLLCYWEASILQDNISHSEY